VHSIVGGGQT